MESKAVLVLGATGYVGSRLVPRLLDWGYSVRAAAQSLEKLNLRPWANNPRVELTAVNVLDPESLTSVCKGCSDVYYLIHSVNPSDVNFAKEDRQAAHHLVRAAEQTGIGRIIYLGWLGEEEDSPSRYLRSRSQIRKILQSGKVPATILRAGMIIGTASGSFEILRYLVKRQPILFAPRWLATKRQPIAIRNVLDYLVGCLRYPETAGKTYDLGGPEVLTCLDVMKIYAEETKLPKRLTIPIPGFLPKLSSYGIHLVTPLHTCLARGLSEVLSSEASAIQNPIDRVITQKLLDCRQAIRLSLEQSQHELTDEPQKEAISIPPPEWRYAGDPDWTGGIACKYARSITLKALPSEIWEPLSKIGAAGNWYGGSLFWKLRGLLDRLTGGIGMRLGRTDFQNLNPGDRIDFWRVLRVKSQARLLLVSEMKMPGTGALDFHISRIDNEKTRLELCVKFVPRGMLGFLYWHLISPFYKNLLDSQLKKIAKQISRPTLSGPE